MQLNTDEIIIAICIGQRVCADFTDTGEDDQPEQGTAWSEDAIILADTDARRFWNDNRDDILAAIKHSVESGSSHHTSPVMAAESIGYDLWYTRNGHGVGFWDRPEIWGETNAAKLTEAAEKMGEAFLYLGDSEKIEYSATKWLPT